MVTRNALLYLSRQERLKDFATRFSPFKKMTTRFVAGEDIDETVRAIRELNAHGCTASFDHLNESVTEESETEEEVREYLRILARIDETGIRSNVSIKLTQFGLEIDPELAYRNARRVVEDAARRGNFVRVDMEASNVTQVTLELFRRLRAEFGLNDVGIVVQSYLRRTYDDVQELLKIPARIRLCKGAYNEPPEVAFPDKKDVDENYIRVMRVLLSSGIYHGIATHDPRMIDATLEHAQREGISKEEFEFQMLYGVRRDLQLQLARDGYRMRVYVPYGKHWYPYFMRRLAERPANVWFVLKNMMKG
ncbi:MAG TPA: proline dehydrogenase family protein [Pyrinomonadaceae bacterium]|nr:proline dehydrogenase family protein [Pyrinomonadaceae bacterium]